MDEKQKLLDDVITDMQGHLTKEQLAILYETLVKQLEHVKIQKQTDLFIPRDFSTDVNLLKLYVASKRLEGASEKTIQSYLYATKRMLLTLNKSIYEIDTIDIKYYLSDYKRTHNISQRTLDNLRKNINGVFLWLYENQYIEKNPLKPIKPFPYEKKEVEILNDEEIFLIRELSRKNLRTQAIVELLLSTGIRVSELCAINIEDINFEKNEIIIHCAKKKRKQNRTMFLTMDAKICLQRYLEYRNTLTSPDGSALFVANRNGGKRCTERLVNSTLREIERQAQIHKKVTVHMFRRTFGSQLWRRGCSLLTVSKLLGHEDTRMCEKYYIGVNYENIKSDYYRYM